MEKCVGREAVPLTEEQIREIIKNCDADHDNRLDMKDLEKAFRQLGSKLPGFRATRVMRYADANRDGFIDFNELNDVVRYAQRQGYSIK